MGRKEVTEYTPLNSHDLSLINASLGNARTQYTDPIARIGDPLAGAL